MTLVLLSSGNLFSLFGRIYTIQVEVVEVVQLTTLATHERHLCQS